VNDTVYAVPSELGKVQLWTEPQKHKAVGWTDGPFIWNYR